MHIPLYAQGQQLSSEGYHRMISKSFLPAFTPADTARISSLINVAKGSMREKQPDHALALLQQIIKESGSIGYTDGIATAFYYMGMILARTGRLDSALQVYRMALPYCRMAYYDKRLGHSVYHNIGMIYTSKGHSETAIRYYDTALQEAVRARLPEDYRFLSATYVNIGSLYMDIGRYGTAMSYFDKAKQIGYETEYFEGLVFVMMNKGLAYKVLGKLDSARICFAEGLRIAKKHSARGGRHTVYMHVYQSVMMLEQDKAEDALLSLEKVEQTINEHNLVVHENMKLYLFLGESFLKLKAYPKAEYYLKLTVLQAQKMELQKFEMNAAMALSKLYEESGRAAHALEELKHYVRISDSLFSKEKTKQINEFDIKYRSAEKDKQILLQQIALHHRNIWAGIATGGLVLLLVGLLFFYKQKKHKQAISQLKAIMKGEEQERTRIARELHDGIGSMLATIKMGLSYMHNKPASGLPYNQLMNIVGMTAGEVRRTAHNLMPAILERNGLEEALNQYCMVINQKSDLHAEIHFNGPMHTLDKGVMLFVYRIVQELLQNVIKHARAGHADVQITRLGNKLSITVEDNGIGFDETEEKESGGMGLSNLRQRVQLLNGCLFVDSVKGKSTTVFIELNLERLAAIA